MSRSAILRAMAVTAWLAAAGPAIAEQPASLPETSGFQLGTPFPNLRSDGRPNRARGRLQLLLYVGPSCSVSLPRPGRAVDAARVACTGSIPFFANLTPIDDQPQAFVTLDFVAAGDAWAPLDPKGVWPNDPGFVPVRFNLDY